MSSIFSPDLTFKSWILTSEKSFTSCPNGGGGGGGEELGNLDKIQKNSSFLSWARPFGAIQTQTVQAGYIDVGVDADVDVKL